MPCTMTHGEHLRTWRSWRDDCTGDDGCGFGMVDYDQCENGHPDDGVTLCGACGYDAVYNALKVGELSAIFAKADASGVNYDGWSIAQTIRAFPLTAEESAKALADLAAQGAESRRRRAKQAS